MATVRLCLLLVIFINVCTDHVPGQPIFWSLFDYDDDSNSTSTDDDDYDLCGWFWACENRRRTTTARPTIMPPAVPRPGAGSVQFISPQPINITVTNSPDGSWLLSVNPWSGSAPAGGPAPSPNSPAPSPSGPATQAPPAPGGSTTAAPTTAAGTTTAAATTPAATTAATTAAG